MGSNDEILPDMHAAPDMSVPDHSFEETVRAGDVLLPFVARVFILFETEFDFQRTVK